MLKIYFADLSDDEAIRRILNETQMDVPISIIFNRYPSYFNSLKIDGEDFAGIVGKDEKGIVRGFGTCVYKRMFINGKIEKVGYFHNLRLEKKYRDGYSLALGYKKFREILNKKEAFCYFTSILSDNKLAIKVLTSGKGGMPSYNYINKYRTFIIKSGNIVKTTNNFKILKASSIGLKRTYEKYIEISKNRNFAPYYSFDSFYSIPKFNKEKLFCIMYKDEIIGVCGLWNISQIKQIFVARYNRFIKLIKPFHNVLSYITHKPKLPSVNKIINYSFIFPFMIDPNYSDSVINILNRLSVLSKEDNNSFFVVGSLIDSNFSKFINKFPNIHLDSNIYIVDWNQENKVNKLSELPLHLEVGLL